MIRRVGEEELTLLPKDCGADSSSGRFVCPWDDAVVGAPWIFGIFRG